MFSIEQLEEKIAILEAKLEKHRICPIYSILTRTGLEEAWERFREIENLAIAFIDIDDLKKVNSEMGQFESNKRISEAFSLVRTKELLAQYNFEFGRFYYGDEALIMAPAHEIVFPCDRVLAALKERGLSATIVIARYTGESSLTDAVADANTMNQILKRQGKGRVYNFL